MKKEFILSLLVFVSHIATSQSGQYDYSPYKPAADSVVVEFLGNSIKNQFVQLDLAKCAYLKISNGKIIRSGFNKSLSFVPDFYQFVYQFRHPAFNNKSLDISLLINPAHQLSIISNEVSVSTTDPYKLENFATDPKVMQNYLADTLSVTSVARVRELLPGKSKGHLELVWLPYPETKNSYLIGPGSSGIAWSVKGTESFRGKKYKGYYQVDLKSGRLIKRFAIPWD